MSESIQGIGLNGLLGLIFITLKLTGYIAWSWWLVLAPFWIPVALVFVVLAFLLAFGAKATRRNFR